MLNDSQSSFWLADVGLNTLVFLAAIHRGCRIRAVRFIHPSEFGFAVTVGIISLWGTWHSKMAPAFRAVIKINNLVGTHFHTVALF